MGADTLAEARAYGAPVVVEFPVHSVSANGRDSAGLEAASGIDEPDWYEAGVDVDHLSDEELTPFVKLEGTGRTTPVDRAAFDPETGDDLRAFLGRGSRIGDML